MASNILSPYIYSWRTATIDRNARHHHARSS